MSKKRSKAMLDSQAMRGMGLLAAAFVATAAGCAGEEVAGHDFTPQGAGFRAEPRGQRIEIAGGVISLATREADEGAGGRRSLGASVTVTTTAARRGAQALDVTPLATTQVAPNLVETKRAAFTEQLRSTAEGAEQSWRFAQPPGAQGDLVVQVTPAGVAYLSSSAEGLQFVRAGELTLRYSHGVWIEADGDRTAIPAQFVNGQIQLTVPAVVMAGTAFPAVLDPQIIVTPISGQ